MNYKKIYDDLILQAKINIPNGYTEVHHIIPKSLGGNNLKDNLIRLSPRQHYIAHLLLYKIHKGNGIYGEKMLYALMCMKYGTLIGIRKFGFNSKLYAKFKEQYSKLRSKIMTQNNNMSGKVWIVNYFTEVNMIWDSQNIDLPDGFIYGRCLNFKLLNDFLTKNGISKEEFILNRSLYGGFGSDIHLKRKQSKKIKIKTDRCRGSKIKINYVSSIQNISKKDLKRLENKKKREMRNELLQEMYFYYVQNGFQKLKEKYNYTKSRENLTMAFKKHVPEYDKNILFKTTMKIKKENNRFKQSKENERKTPEEKIKYFSEIYQFFKDHTFEETISMFNWESSRNALLCNFKKYVKEYIPKRTSRWSK